MIQARPPVFLANHRPDEDVGVIPIGWCVYSSLNSIMRKGFEDATAEPWAAVAGGTDLARSHRLPRLWDELIRSRGDFLCRGLNFFRDGQNLFRHRPNSFRDGLNLFVADKTFSLSDQSQSIRDQTFSVADQSQSTRDLTFSMTDQTFSSGRKAFP